MSTTAKKQGTLFSFFSKKKPSETSDAPKEAKEKVKVNKASSESIAKTPPVASSNVLSNPQADLLASITVGCTLSVYWPNDDEYYTAKVTAKKNTHSNTNIFTLLYDDGEVETLDLTNEKFKLVKKPNANGGCDDDDEKIGMRKKSNNTQSSKKRRILEESDEEEFEFDDDVVDDEVSDNDESEFEETNEDEDEDEDMDDFDPTDDEEERPRHKRIATKKAQITAVKSPNLALSVSFITPPPKKAKIQLSSATSKSNAFTAFASGSKNESDDSNLNRKVTPTQNKSPATLSSTPSSKAPMPLQGVVNPAGSHYHNHYSFLQPSNIRDAQNRPMSHPEYDPRTLKVDGQEIERVNGSKLTPAAQQWWDIKSQYADTLLLFKTGKFYEIFHMDADVAVQVLGFTYMKGPIAHAGFPEISYGIFCEKLVRAGYKVARVEQTETPEMLKERKQKTKSGKKPQVVAREVCSIVTAGTRTFCYMDDVSVLDSIESGNTNQDGFGPLLVVKETILEQDSSSQNNSEDESPTPVCEYGITVIDAATGVITLGQFADDVLRSRMSTLITKFRPSEILFENGPFGASETLKSLLKSIKNTMLPACVIGHVNCKESFPKSTAVDDKIRSAMQRHKSIIQPWNVDETLQELHRRKYYPRESRRDAGDEGIGRWPQVLKACVEGQADLALASFGAALFYLQRNLIDHEILSMGVVKAYIPPDPGMSSNDSRSCSYSTPLNELASHEQRVEDGIETMMPNNRSNDVKFSSVECDPCTENEINHMSLDGTTIANLEILANSHSNTIVGSLWSKINYTKSPSGARLLRAWLLRPLFKKCDIDRRADAVQELVTGSASAAMSEARNVLAKCGDIERLLSRVAAMGGNGHIKEDNYHPNERAVLYESATHTKRKVGDFSKLLFGLRGISRIPEIFDGLELGSDLLKRVVRTTDDGGLFPVGLTEQLDWFFENFDCKKASNGLFEPSRGIDDDYDAACDAIDRIKAELEQYKDEMCVSVLKPSHSAKREWNYVNTKPDSKDKYLIELPINIQVPSDFIVKGKRGKGIKQVNKYSTPVVERLVTELERAYDALAEGKSRGMQLVFAKFDSMRSLWTSAVQASAMLDALGALALASSKSGYSRPNIIDCPYDSHPIMNFSQGRHPCVDITHSGNDFIPNDLALGGDNGSRILLLSGPNMGGKSTLLRQTCLIAILAQIGCFVPAEECTMTPFDRIFTRLGASDRILLGQSTFFVELAETAAALRGAKRRSLVIMDELGRGTSTFDGTAIASAAVKHLIENNKCLTLFATHYHSLLEDFKNEPNVRLGHMQCYVEDQNENSVEERNITFLYTLGEGSCPKSFGINVARIAGLPEDVLEKARIVSSSFEAFMSSLDSRADNDPIALKKRIEEVASAGDWSSLETIWLDMQ